MTIKDLQDIAEAKAGVVSLEKRLGDHVTSDDHRFNNIDESLDMLRIDVSKMKDNHLQHLETDMADVKTDVAWLKRFFWIVITASVGALATGIINLMINYK